MHESASNKENKNMKKSIMISVLIGGAVFSQGSRVNAETSCPQPILCPTLTANEVTKFLGQETLTKNEIDWVLVPQHLEPTSRTQIADSDGTCSYEDAHGVLRFKLKPKGVS